jgi:formylmethanofuran dehydrogenase subunit C
LTVRRTRPSIAGRSRENIAGEALHLGRCTVADLFEVEERGEREIAIRGEESEITLRRSSDRLCAIGEGMSEGRIEVHGSAGDYLGRGMRGGHIRVRGSAGHCVGEGMRGGLIEVSRDVGDFAGGAATGATEGMNEGTILVSGNAGHWAGDRMRRGMLVVKGGAGDHLGEILQVRVS